MLATGKEKISVASTSASAIQSKTTKAAEGPWLRNCSTQVVILSYNVWFREDLQLEGRMEAIGELILQHQPHIICFQVPFLHHMICFQEFLYQVTSHKCQFQSRETFFAEEADICLIWDAGSDREYICHFPTIQLVETVSVFCQSWFSGNARLLLYAGRQIPFLWEHGRLILLLSKLSSSSPLNNQDSWSLWSQEENQKIHVRSPGRFLRPLFFLKALNWASSSSHSFWKVSFRKCNWQLTD